MTLNVLKFPLKLEMWLIDWDDEADAELGSVEVQEGDAPVWQEIAEKARSGYFEKRRTHTFLHHNYNIHVYTPRDIGTVRKEPTLIVHIVRNYDDDLGSRKMLNDVLDAAAELLSRPEGGSITIRSDGGHQ